jgi:hypothetical protein
VLRQYFGYMIGRLITGAQQNHPGRENINGRKTVEIFIVGYDEVIVLPGPFPDYPVVGSRGKPLRLTCTTATNCSNRRTNRYDRLASSNHFI